MIMIIKLIKLFMAKIDSKKFVPTPAEVQLGAQPMSKLEIVKSLAAYKLQNPTKYEAKKAALFARYGLDASDEAKDIEPDASDIELKKVEENLTKEVKAKK